MHRRIEPKREVKHYGNDCDHHVEPVLEAGREEDLGDEKRDLEEAP